VCKKCGLWATRAEVGVVDVADVVVVVVVAFCSKM
jgi:hypothetical protein